MTNVLSSIPYSLCVHFSRLNIIRLQSFSRPAAAEVWKSLTSLIITFAHIHERTKTSISCSTPAALFSCNDPQMSALSSRTCAFHKLFHNLRATLIAYVSQKKIIICSVVAQHCKMATSLSDVKNGKFDPLSNRNPRTDCQNLSRLIRQRVKLLILFQI